VPVIFISVGGPNSVAIFVEVIDEATQTLQQSRYMITRSYFDSSLALTRIIDSSRVLIVGSDIYSGLATQSSTLYTIN